MYPRVRAALFTLLLACLVLSSCASSDMEDLSFGPLFEDRDMPVGQCPFGQPVYTCTYTPCTAPIVVNRPQYELGYSPDKGTALWACETVEARELRGDATRPSHFLLDPYIPRTYQASPWVYEHSGFHRGHLVAAANQKWNQSTMDQTFFISNAAPMHPKLNGPGGVWDRLERYVRELVRRNSERKFYVISGPSFHVERVPIAKGPDRRGDLQEVHIPSHFYKIVALPVQQGGWKAIGFLVENQNKLRMHKKLSSYVRPIQHIESVTHLDFFPELPPHKRIALEHMQTNWNDWKLMPKNRWLKLLEKKTR